MRPQGEHFVSAASWSSAWPPKGTPPPSERLQPGVIDQRMEVRADPPRRVAWLLLCGLLLVVGIISAWLGSADPPIDVRNGAYWYRTLRKIPGLTDVCGDFTWLARAVPPAVATLGGVVALLHRPRSILSLGAGAFGLAVAAGLAFATMQNAVPLGEIHCIS